jgi:transposase
MWCIGKLNSEFVKRMYDILDLYEQPYDPRRPVIGLDEKPKQLLGDKRTPISMKKGTVEKYDYEYQRNGKANIFVAIDFKGGKRVAKVTRRRKKKDFAYFVKQLVDNKFRNAKQLRLVVDNLNTHFKSSFEETFEKTESHRILNKVEFHYTPKHGSWLNVAETEIGVMDAICTGRRIPDIEILRQEVNAWSSKRNKEKKKINWKFTKEKADKKLAKHYVT